MTSYSAVQFYSSTLIFLIGLSSSVAYLDFYWGPWNVTIPGWHRLTIPGWHRYKYFERPEGDILMRQYVLQEQSPR